MINPVSNAHRKALLFFLILFGLGKTPVEAGSNRKKTPGLFRDEQHQFSIVFPPSWKIKDGRNPNVIVKATSENGKGLESINIIVRDVSHDTKTSDITTLLQSKNIIPKGNQVLGHGTTKIDNRSALWAKSEKKYQALDITLHAIDTQIACMNKGKMYILTASVGRETSDEATKAFFAAEAAMMKSLRSFQIEDWEQVK